MLCVLFGLVGENVKCGNEKTVLCMLFWCMMWGKSVLAKCLSFAGVI
jgi:hypothetical protein